MKLSFAVASIIFILMAGCSDSDAPITTPQNKTSKNQPAKPSNPNNSEKNQYPDQEVVAPVTSPNDDEAIDVTSKNLDYTIIPILSELRHQLQYDPFEQENAIKNVELANRVLEINFQYGNPSELKLVTHTKKGIHFNQTSQKGNIQYFKAYQSNTLFFPDQSDSTVVYTAEAKTTQSGNRTISIIKIRDIETGAIIHILFVQKNGKVSYSLKKGYSYDRELTPTSRTFLERLLKRPEARATFYTIVTKEPNFSNAYRFNVVFANEFVMETYPLFKHYSQSEPRVVPLKIQYYSFLKTMFFGSASYSAVDDPKYLIQVDRNPVEVKTLNIEVKLDGLEKVKGQKNSLPVIMHIRF